MTVVAPQLTAPPAIHPLISSCSSAQIQPFVCHRDCLFHRIRSSTVYSSLSVLTPQIQPFVCHRDRSNPIARLRSDPVVTIGLSVAISSANSFILVSPSQPNPNRIFE
ncbi:unnamed protein product [Citrullus colocynthis]|uniref:Uncharacterized protein n=1 Tax=Citrullus colocynthis TaxID=252529 RepID=A0ABP0YCH3_9ROSI